MKCEDKNPAVLRVRKPFRAGEARNKEKVQIQEPLEQIYRPRENSD